ncbi:MAG: hypothetical protein L3J51_13050 [Cocleimonas sp.]|nr:hypothetical protein [Cocleimonas sp.]
MQTTDSALFTWDKDAYNNFGKKLQCLQHQLDLVDDDSLTKLLDEYPRKWLQCFTMGYNPEDYSEWKAVHIEKSTGKEILDAVKKGRFWINIINIDKADERFATVIEKIYTKIAENSGHLKDIKCGYSALLLSSPGIQVYYHLDAEANMLWHLKGEKKIWVYPKDSKFSPQDELEKVVAQEKDEDLPYKRHFDDSAKCFVLQAGDVISWPIHSPHRVENITVNLSLASSYSSGENRRLNAVHCANHFILKKLGLKNRSTVNKGMASAVKAYSYLVLNKLNLIKRKDRTSYYKTNLVLDPNSDSGMTTLQQSSYPVFAKQG